MRKKLSYSEAGKLGAAKSYDVQQRQKRDRINLYNSNPKRCLTCEKTIPYEKRKSKFCNHSCAAIKNNIPRANPKNCLSCGKPLKAKNKYRAKYCDHTCQHNYQRNQKWDKVNIDGKFEDGADGHRVRRFLLSNRDHQCSICHTTEWTGQEVPLVVDHIDGDPYNNRLDNLRLVCPNCDALLPTYKGKNKGNGRHKRRQRYADGKSY